MTTLDKGRSATYTTRYWISRVKLIGKKHQTVGIASMVLGVIGLVTWFMPFWGLPIPIIGLVLGIVGMSPAAPHRGMAIAGVVMCSIGLLLSIMITLGFISLFFWS